MLYYFKKLLKNYKNNRIERWNHKRMGCLKNYLTIIILLLTFMSMLHSCSITHKTNTRILLLKKQHHDKPKTI
ncbi:MAG: hypothetical protein [Microvirus sp.]|nr:MAG: hypothetical protein [Microvirus sp.]